MTWLGDPVYWLALLTVAVTRLGVDWWLLHTGRVVRYKLVPHRKLRAVSATARRGSAEHSAGDEPRPTPGPESPGVGLNHNTRWTRKWPGKKNAKSTATNRTAGNTPASTATHSATSSPKTTTDSTPQHRATTPLPRVPSLPDGTCGGPGRQPVGIGVPRTSVPAGSQPRNRGDSQGHEPGAPSPDMGAPVRGVA